MERPFGELLFASAVIIGDGATERALIPPVLRHSLKGRAHGVCVVDPGSMNSEHAVAIVKFAQLVGIPWFLFSDSDKPGQKAARDLIQIHGDGNESRVVWVREPSALVGTRGIATEQMLIDFSSDLCERACETIGFEQGADVLKFMSRHKGAIGSLIANELIKLGEWPAGESEQNSLWPLPICSLVRKLDVVLPRLEAKPDAAT